MNAEKTLRIGQGGCFIAGGILVVISIWKATLLGGIPTAELGLAAFALAFVAAAGAAYVDGQTRRAGLSLLGAIAFVVLIVEPYSMGVFGAIVLFLVGILLMADSLAEEGLRERVFL